MRAHRHPPPGRVSRRQETQHAAHPEAANPPGEGPGDRASGRDVHDQLRAYLVFVAGPKDYVINQALRLLFRKDREFAAWRAAHPEASDGARSVNTPTAAEPSPAGSRPTLDATRSQGVRR